MFTTLVISSIGLVVIYFWLKNRKQKQLSFIENYQFPQAILDRAKQKHDYLSDKDMQKVAQATKDYFYICNQAKGKMVSMPSEIVDVLWHEFILFTRAYESFCKKGIGRFLHHVPTEAMTSKTSAQEGIKRAWRLSCAKENIHPKRPDKLPLLFVIDKVLEIKGGFNYDLRCKAKPYNSNSGSSCGGYCATDIGCASGCAGESTGSSSESSFFGDGDGGSSCSSCGGSSCGSGCGGD